MSPRLVTKRPLPPMARLPGAVTRICPFGTGAVSLDEALIGIWTLTSPAVVRTSMMPPLLPGPPSAVTLPLANDTMPSAWTLMFPPLPPELDALITALVPPSWLKATAVPPVVTMVTLPAFEPLRPRTSSRPVSFMLFALSVTAFPCARRK